MKCRQCQQKAKLCGCTFPELVDERMDDDFDPYDEEYLFDPREDCDCIDADLDILTGIERCHICGRSRFLSGEEFTRRLQQEAEWAAAYHEAMASEEQPS